MPLTPGARLGPYEILALIGAGGMGEVYRARDARLKRDVALKILPESFASDPERLARFQREAEVLASLNHPHIAAIYGLEDADDVKALVMEFVEGEDLAQRIARGVIPLDEALPIARQVAEALEAAHEQGIIHRDLKPANIRLRPDGTVKVLDFGLAKLTAPTSPAGSAASVSVSPTITSPAMMTGVGVLLGTAAYMSPEQAKGREADKRSDVWAFGCVLYEMLTGRRAFDGEDLSDTLASVLKSAPDWNALPVDVPPHVRVLIQRCLAKDRRQRIADISVALFVISDPALIGDRSSALAPTDIRNRSPLWRRATPLAAVVIMSAMLTGAGVWWLTRPAPASLVRTTIATSGPTILALHGTDRDIAITPDGSRLVYRGNNQLLVRPLNRLEPDVLTGLGAPRGVFLSPDGQWIGFFDGNTIRKVAITGGSPVTITPAGAGSRGATWGPDGTIVFATGETATGLQRVSSAGGQPTVLTKPDRGRAEGDHFWPEFLPGGEAILFTIIPATGGIESAQVAVLALRTGMSKVLIRGGSHAHYVPTGHLVYGVMGTLRAVAFDLGRLEVVGTPLPVLEGVVTTAVGAADIAVAANGSLVYVPGDARSAGLKSVVSVDRQGRALPLPGLAPGPYRDVRVSLDGDRLALATDTDVWTYDVVRATLSRLTTDPAADTRPLWTPDGQRIIFTSQRRGHPELFSRAADGTGTDEPFLARASELLDLRANDWSADGRQLLYTEVDVSLAGQCALAQVAAERPADSTVLLKSEFCPDYAALSPDGRWMAYQSRVSGRSEIYVEEYPKLGSRKQISGGGGRFPVWSRDGRELFFAGVDNRQIFAVRVQSGTTLVAGRPLVLFEMPMFVAPGNRPYDIGPNGRFLIIQNDQAEATGGGASNLILVQNWFEELKRLVLIN